MLVEWLSNSKQNYSQNEKFQDGKLLKDKKIDLCSAVRKN